jgi:hypothetical protein
MIANIMAAHGAVYIGLEPCINTACVEAVIAVINTSCRCAKLHRILANRANIFRGIDHFDARSLIDFPSGWTDWNRICETSGHGLLWWLRKKCHVPRTSRRQNSAQESYNICLDCPRRVLRNMVSLGRCKEIEAITNLGLDICQKILDTVKGAWLVKNGWEIVVNVI